MTRTLHRLPDRRCLPVAEWPAADRTLWQEALVAGDLLEDGGARAGYSKISNAKVQKGYGRWLGWLAVRGLPDGGSPADRITSERVKEYMAELRTINASWTRLSRLHELYEAARVMDPQRDWSWIRRIAARVRAGHIPARSKRTRLVGSSDLWSLGETLMASAPSLSTGRLRAMSFRDGLIIALLAARPLRLRNLAGLELERTLVRRGDGWWIAIPGEETKTRDPIEVPWPEALSAALAAYLTDHRPLLCRLRNRWTRPIGNALWVSSHASPMTNIALYDVITARTKWAFGRPINPHLFRDCAATTIAIEDPKHVRVAARVLGHRSLATTERHYNQSRAIDAARRYQDFLVGLRQDSITLSAPDAS